MKIAVVNNCVPFLRGGAEYLAEALVRKLIEHGHQAVLIRVPFRWHPPEQILKSMLACRLLRVPNVDRVVALKFPAYYVPHPNKVLWLLHQFRQVYDLWGTPYQDLPDSELGESIRRAVIRADDLYLRQAVKIYTNSEVTRDRLKRYNQLEAEVLHPPLERSDHLICEGYEDYCFYPSRITASKRQELAVEAMRHVRSRVRLVIAGQPETSGELTRIQERIQRWNLRDRVALIPRFISEEEKASLLSRALGCLYLAYDEDSYGFVVLESYHARKPVITCTDSGGTMLLVKEGRTGIVVKPDPKALAAAMDRLYEDRREAQRLGEAGLDLIRSLDISWRRVVEALTQ
jgi:glycosyltransferase involved in cell wall biosynthesis